MALDQFQMVTALTIASIGAILLLYFIVLKRKGWLTEETKSVTSYLCPNPQCRKVFEEPIKLTDLSQKPPRVFLGCPHCGIDMEKIPAISAEKAKTEDHDFPPIKPVVNGTQKTQPSQPSNKNTFDVKSVSVQDPPSPAILQMPPQAKSPPKPLPQTLTKTAEINHKPEQRKSAEAVKACKHYLGYVKTLPKSTPIPDECMWCTSIVKCLTGTEKIEA